MRLFSTLLSITLIRSINGYRMFSTVDPVLDNGTSDRWEGPCRGSATASLSSS